MFSFKSAIFVATALATLTAATPTALMAHRNTPASSCSTGSLTSCQSSGSAKDAGIASLIATLDIDVGDIDGLTGATCSPITGIGAGDASCSAKALRCDNNTFSRRLRRTALRSTANDWIDLQRVWSLWAASLWISASSKYEVDKEGGIG